MVAMEPWNVDELFQAVRGAAPFAELSRVDLRRRARHALGTLPVGRLRGPAAATHVGPLEERGHRARRREARGRHQRRHDSRPRPLRRVPDRRARPARARRRARRGDGLREPRRRDLPARRLVVAHRGDHARPGASCRRRRGSPGKMPFWKADAAGRPLELGRHIGELVRSLAADAAGRRDCSGSPSITISTRAPPRTCCATSPIRRPPTGAVPDDRTIVIERTRDELGDWRICVLSPFGGRIHAPWAMAVGRARRAPKPAATPRRCGPTTGSSCGFRKPRRRPIPRCCCPRPTRRRRWSCGSSAARRCSPRSSARRRPARCCCRAGGPAAARRSGSSASARRICSAVAAQFGSFPDDPRGVPRSAARRLRHPRAASTRCGGSRRARSAPSPSTRRCRRRSRRRCSSATSPTTSTTATRRWRNAARRRSRSIRRSCASCSAKRSCASCSTPTRSPTWSAQLQQLDERYRARSVDGVHDLLLHLGDLAARRDRRARRSMPADGAIDALARDAPRRSRSASAAEHAFVPVEYAGALSRCARRAAAGRAARVAARAVAATRRSISRGATRERTGRSRPPSSPRATRSAESTADALLKTLAAGGTAARGRVPARRLAGASGATPRSCRRSAADRWRRLRKEVEPVEPPVLARLRHGVAGAGTRRAAGSTRCSTRSRTCRGRRCRRRSSRREILAGAHRRLLARRSRRARRGRRSRLARRRAGRRSRRPHRALPHRSPAAAVAPAPADGALAGASRRSSTHSSGTARRSSRRCTRRPAADIPGETVDALWDLVWKGMVTNDTFHALRAFTRAPREAAAQARAGTVGRRSAAGASRRRPRKAAGRCSPNACRARRPTRSGPPRWRSSSWRATAS